MAWLVKFLLIKTVEVALGSQHLQGGVGVRKVPEVCWLVTQIQVQ